MGTRAAVAYPWGDGWKGVYSHFDGYPTGLGMGLFDLYHNEFGESAVAMIEGIIKANPQGYSFAGELATAYDKGDHEMISTCKCATGDNSKCDPLFIEWAYVLSPAGMSVFTAVSHPTMGYRHQLVGFVAWNSNDPQGDLNRLERQGRDICEEAYATA